VYYYGLAILRLQFAELKIATSDRPIDVKKCFTKFKKNFENVKNVAEIKTF